MIPHSCGAQVDILHWLMLTWGMLEYLKNFMHSFLKGTQNMCMLQGFSGKKA